MPKNSFNTAFNINEKKQNKNKASMAKVTFIVYIQTRSLFFVSE